MRPIPVSPMVYGLKLHRSAILSVTLYPVYAVIEIARPVYHKLKVPLEFVTEKDMHGVTHALDESGCKVELEFEDDGMCHAERKAGR